MRRFKALAALIAAFCLLSMGSAPGASAVLFHAEEAPVTLTAKSFAGTTFKVNAGTNVCGAGGLTGSSVNKTDEALTVTLSDFPGCSFYGPDTVEMNSCDFVIHANGTLDIAGANCAKDKIYFGTVGLCWVEIGPQSNLKGLSYWTLWSGKERQIWMEMSVKGIVYTQGGFLCTNGTFASGEMIEATFPISGTNSKAEAQGIWVE